jgi:histidine ammonia-lyase
LLALYCCDSIFRIFTGEKKIRWLAEEALRRYLKLKPPSFVPNREEAVLDIRKTAGGAILDPEDIIKDVLDDNDFVSIGGWNFGT